MNASTFKKTIVVFSLVVGFGLYTLAGTHIIKVRHKQFIPAKLVAYTGDTIQWVWQSGKHNIQSTLIPAGAQSWHGAINSKSKVFQLILSVPGNYNYVSSSAKNMKGTISVDNATVAALLNSDTIKIYPQPFKNSLTIDVGNSNVFKGPVTIEIFDALGQSKYRKSSETILLNPVTLNLPNWPAGYYFLNLSDGNIKEHTALLNRNSEITSLL
jgi:plastocyanin